MFNTIHNTSVQTAAYTLSSGGVFKPILTGGVSRLGTGSASQGFPDGTNARRCPGAGARDVLRLDQLPEGRVKKIGDRQPRLRWAIVLSGACVTALQASR